MVNERSESSCHRYQKEEEKEAEEEKVMGFEVSLYAYPFERLLYFSKCYIYSTTISCSYM